MKFKSYYWAIIAAAVIVPLVIIVPSLLSRGGSTDPSNPHTPEELARLKQQATDFTPQIAAYTDLITANPTDTVAMVGLGDLYLNNGKYSDAADWYKKATDVNPKEPLFHTWLGEAYFQMGMVDVGMREIQSALALDPNNQATLVVLGLFYSQTGKTDEAKQTWQKAYDINPAAQYGHVAKQLLAGPQTTTGQTTTGAQ
ncbi:MAG: tetratricopeptide repeat protein [Thermoleophilia bacterium]